MWTNWWSKRNNLKLLDSSLFDMQNVTSEEWQVRSDKDKWRVTSEKWQLKGDKSRVIIVKSEKSRVIGLEGHFGTDPKKSDKLWLNSQDFQVKKGRSRMTNQYLLNDIC